LNLLLVPFVSAKKKDVKQQLSVVILANAETTAAGFASKIRLKV
jgi:hypothetical protein